MDESIQKQIEAALVKEPEHWVWRYDQGCVLCPVCVKTKAQPREVCVNGHTNRSGVLPPEYRGEAVLYGARS